MLKIIKKKYFLKKVLTLKMILCNIVYVVSAKQIRAQNTNEIWLLGQAVKTPPFHGGIRGSIPLGVTNFGRIAQLGEHLPYKQGVTGSIPVVTTIKIIIWLSSSAG